MTQRRPERKTGVSVLLLVLLMSLLKSAPSQVAPDAENLYGVHWYPNTDSLSIGQTTDVEAMTDGKDCWVLEITHLNTTATAPAPWLAPGYARGHAEKVVTGKGNSVILRIQPFWDANVPHPDDPFTIANFADEAKNAAITLQDFCHIWQVGNEVNLDIENRRWNATNSNYSGATWQPTPEQYADTYVAVRDKIHEIPTNSTGVEQIVLMQPVSPGTIIGGVRFMDGNEFLWRQIDAVADKGKIDGFALHGYAEPGGANFGLDGFWESITEQLAIIDQFGLGDRPIYICEWNKHMPDAGNASIGASFLHRAYTHMHNWNQGTGGLWPGHGNHNIVGAMWFVYPKSTGWDDYSVEYWKTAIASTDKETNPWYSFNYAGQQDYPAGVHGGGPTVSLDDQLWWEDDFDGASLDTTAGPPDWKIETTNSGTVIMSGAGQARFLGNGSNGASAGIRTAGYAYGDFHLETEFEFTNASKSNASSSEANFDLRIREGSRGYSLTFYTGDSPANPNQIILRRTNAWSQIGSHAMAVPGGINTGDKFKVVLTADGAQISYKVYKNDASAPVLDWDVADSEQAVGHVRLVSYNVAEVRANHIAIGGKLWTNEPAAATNWNLY